MTRKESGILLVILAVFVAHAVYLQCVAEDAFITFRFARHLVNGHGLVWNIGEPPVEGYTNFLWLLLCALALKLQWNVALTSQILGVASGIGAILCTYGYARRWLALPGWCAWIPCAFLALSGPFAAWAGSGLETSLFGFLLVAGAYWYVGYHRSGSSRHLALACGLLLLATLTRPEGLLVFGWLGALSLLSSPWSTKRLGELAIAGAVYLIPVALYCVWRHEYFGYWLPNTFYAKTGGRFFQYLRGAKYSGLFFGYFVLPLLLPLLPGLGKPPGRPKSLGREGRAARMGLWTCWTVLALYTLYIVYVGGDYMAMFRFFVPLLPFLYLLFGALLHRLWETRVARKTRRSLAAGCLILAAAVTVAFSTPLEARLLPKPRFMHGCYRGILIERWHSARLQLIGRFFHDYKQGPKESLAVEPIGAVSYYADMPVHSISAIVDPHIAHQTKRRSGKAFGKGLPGHEKVDFQYVLAKNPTYILYLKPERYLTPEPRPLILEGPAGSRYRSVSVWLKDAVNGEEGYLSFLELKGARR